MRLRTALPAMAMAIGLSASGSPTIVRDFGLHRAWQVTVDGAHPERPARLVEVPWSTGRTSGPVEPGTKPAAPQPPTVRAGMPVTVIGRGARAEIRLEGTALGTARRGETVPVRAGLGNSIVRGIVRGPGVVELSGEKTR